MDRQCSSCGGFCRKSGCERENVKPEQEPYGYIVRRNWKTPTFIEADNVEDAGLPYNNPNYEPVFKAPPQREWQGLTDEEIVGIASLNQSNDFSFARAIEAKLKEKNT